MLLNCPAASAKSPKSQMELGRQVPKSMSTQHMSWSIWITLNLHYSHSSVLYFLYSSQYEKIGKYFWKIQQVNIELVSPNTQVSPMSIPSVFIFPIVLVVPEFILVVIILVSCDSNPEKDNEKWELIISLNYVTYSASCCWLMSSWVSSLWKIFFTTRLSL